MKRIYNQFPYMENLAKQITTPVSEANIAMAANRPVRTICHMSWPRDGFMSQLELNRVRHFRDIHNSVLRRLKQNDRY